MTESREERLSRIRAVIESPEITNAILGSYTAEGDWQHVNFPDVAWLLAQIGADVEYRVEWRGCESRWRVIEHCASLGEAIEAVGDNRATAPEFDFRVVSAPVQVWTPVEEDQP